MRFKPSIENFVNLFSFSCLSFLSHEPHVYLKKASLFGSLSFVSLVKTSFGLLEINLLVAATVIHLIAPTLFEAPTTHLLEWPATVYLIMLGLRIAVLLAKQLLLLLLR